MPKNIPNNLRRLRKAQNLTQQQVADHLGLQSTNRISRWEKGTLYPHVRNFLKLIALYGARAEDVYGNAVTGESDEGYVRNETPLELS